MRSLLVLSLLAAGALGALASEPAPAESSSAALPLPEALQEMLHATDDDGAPLFDEKSTRDSLAGMPGHVFAVLEEKLDDEWIAGPEQLHTLLSAGLSAQGLELALRDNCVLCHTDPDSQKRRHLFSAGADGPGQFDFRELTADVHFRAGLSCSGCHGGDPEAYDHTDDMLERWPNSRKERSEDKRWVPFFCGRCHSDAAFMRRFNPGIATDQLAKYRQSLHGRLLLEESDSKAAQCVSCHGHHGIRSADSRLSKVHAQNVPETCGACHADAEYMSGYLDKWDQPLPTNQLDEFRRSVHGRALLEEGDLGAPACNDCHGNHAAMPPEVSSVSQVCRNCHLIQGQLFDGSPHKKAFAKNEWPECGRCHGNHGIEVPDDSWIGDTPGTLCHDCHAEHSQDNPDCDETAAHFRDEIAGLVRGQQHLGELGHELRERGLDTESLDAVVTDLGDAIHQTRAKIHSFERSTFGQSAEQGRKLLGRGDELVSAAEGEYRFRLTGLSISIAVMALFATALWLRLREYETRDSSQAAEK